MRAALHLQVSLLLTLDVRPWSADRCHCHWPACACCAQPSVEGYFSFCRDANLGQIQHGLVCQQDAHLPCTELIDCALHDWTWPAGSEHDTCVLTGCLEGLEKTADLVAKQRQTFTEQTQEDLYMSTHAGKAANKKGLGSASAPRTPMLAHLCQINLYISEHSHDCFAKQAIECSP